MLQLLNTKIGRLRIISMMEGISLALLIFVGVPMKYFLASPQVVKIMGPIHGVLFLIFILAAIMSAIEYGWKSKTTAIVFVSALIPFGCFYVEMKLFKEVVAQENPNK